MSEHIIKAKQQNVAAPTGGDTHHDSDDADGGKKEAADDPASDLVWGFEAIGKEINRTRQQATHLHEIGALAGAVAKLGHKTVVGSRHALHRLPFRKMK